MQQLLTLLRRFYNSDDYDKAREGQRERERGQTRNTTTPRAFRNEAAGDGDTVTLHTQNANSKARSFAAACRTFAAACTAGPSRRATGVVPVPALGRGRPAGLGLQPLSATV